MQDDGNFVLRGPGLEVLWASGTDGNGPSFLQVQDDGNVVIYKAPPSSLVATWDTHTALRYEIVIIENGIASGASKIKNESGAYASVIVNAQTLSLPVGHEVYVGAINSSRPIVGEVRSIRNSDPSTMANVGTLNIPEHDAIPAGERWALTRQGSVELVRRVPD
jgi:hypothetical protein